MMVRLDYRLLIRRWMYRVPLHLCAMAFHECSTRNCLPSNCDSLSTRRDCSNRIPLPSQEAVQYLSGEEVLDWRRSSHSNLRDPDGPILRLGRIQLRGRPTLRHDQHVVATSVSAVDILRALDHILRDTSNSNAPRHRHQPPLPRDPARIGRSRSLRQNVSGHLSITFHIRSLRTLLFFLARKSDQNHQRISKVNIGTLVIPPKASRT